LPPADDAAGNQAFAGQEPRLHYTIFMKKSFFIIFFVFSAAFSNAATLTWETTKAAAISKALNENKLVLMLRGNLSCVYCNHAKSTTCETTNPNIVGLIQQHYVPWFSDKSATTEGEEYYDRYPLAGGGYVIVDINPIFACINPNTPDKCYDLSVGDLQIGGELTTTSFYARLSSHIIEKSKEKVKLIIFWQKTGKDKFLLKLQFLSDTKPFNDNSEVHCQLGRFEDEVIAKQKAKVNKNKLIVKANNAKLKLSWNEKTKVCKLLFKVNKSTLDQILSFTANELPSAGSRVTQFKMIIDTTKYYFYPRADFARKGIIKTTAEFFRK